MSQQDNMRWVWRASAAGVVLIGWVFILLQNHRHITAPVVFVCLGYLAVVATVYNLWRTGAAAVASDEEDGDSTWAKPAGARGELEREKRTLLKAIKEAEFDHQMGKLSQRDVDGMIRMYRTRAIEVIKEIDRLGHGAAGTTREQILREVRARLELEARAQKKGDARPAGKASSDAPAAAGEGPASSGKAAKAKKKAGKEPGKASERGEAAAADSPRPAVAEVAAAATGEASPGATDVAPAVKDGSAASDASESSEATQAGKSGGAAETAAASVARGTGEVAGGHREPARAQARPVLDDEAMDADSTTALEPAREDSAKEATP